MYVKPVGPGWNPYMLPNIVGKVVKNMFRKP
jgi:hypothetical protein